jgi:flagellar assembly protein FliH
MRIIKDAKVSHDPVVIAMHKFEELEVPAVPQQDVNGAMEDEAQQASAAAEPFLGATKPSAEEMAAAAADTILRNAQSGADQLYADAMKEIARLKAIAAGEADTLKKQAIAEGSQQGLAEANRQMLDQLQHTAERCNELMATATQEAKQIVLAAERQIIELVMTITRKIISDELEERPEIILGVVREALGRVRDQDHLNIHVSLDDYERILQSRNELQSIVGSEKSFTVTADTVLERGGCLIETSFGTVEAGIDTQLESIRKAIQEMLP